LDTGSGDAAAGERVWFKKAPARAGAPLLARKRRRFRNGDDDVDGDGDLVIGPIRVKPAEAAYIPQVGDVLMGKLQAPSSSSSSRTSSGGCSSKFLFWYPDAYRLFVLARLVRLGTALTESDLASELRIGVSSGVRGGGGAARWATFRRCGGADRSAAAAPGGDDVWAVARLVLFGNVAAFANDVEGGKMNLSVSPLQFVYTCTLHFGDTSIWEHFKKLVPDAELPPFEGDDGNGNGGDHSPPAASHRPPRRVKPLSLSFVHMAPPLPQQQQQYSGSGGGAEPVSPPFYPTTPPSAPYNPNTTPPASPLPPSSYAPASPAYNPASSAYDPQALDAAGAADEYDPDRPTYDSTPLAAAPAPAPVMSVDSILAILKRVADLEETQK
jgi:hypothetical protein